MELPSQQDFWTFYRAHDNELNALYPQITDSNNIDALARRVPGAEQNDSARKERVIRLVQETSDYYSSIDTIVDAIERERQSVTASVKAIKKKLAIIRREMREKRELADLRKEQASDVQNKNSANYHSSLLGLWRPLHPNTRGV
jgi:predicted  nucleic acid-binding Zn-ribbon protein